MVVLGVHRPREQVVPVGLAVFCAGVEVGVPVEPLRAVGVLLVAGPLDARAAPELLVGDARVVARTPTGTLLPGLEGLLGVLPLYERLPVLIAEVHAPRVLQKDVEVVLRLTGRLDRRVREVDRAVGVRVGAGLLAPGGRRQDHVGELGRLRQEDVLDDDEEVLAL